jgi:hypothetical protein
MAYYEKRWCRTYINHALDTDVSPDVIMALRRATHARTSLCRSCLESPTQGCEADADMLLATRSAWLCSWCPSVDAVFRAAGCADVKDER